MSKYLLFLLVVTVLGFGIVGEAAAQVNVTFVVNTSTVPDTLTPISSVTITGDHAAITAWGAGAPLTNIGGDYWSTTIAFNPGDSVRFKIRVSGAWESNSDDVDNLTNDNRSLIVGSSDTTLPVQFFNNGANGRPQYWRPWTEHPDTMYVLFRVNMDGVIQAGSFGYNNDVDTVGVRGGGPAGGDLNWSPTFYLTRESPAANGGFGYPANRFWSGVLRLPRAGVTEGQEIQYKYLIGYDWGRDELQGQPNRSFFVPTGKKDTTLYYSYFNNQKPTARVNADTSVVTFRVNMAKAIQSGGFAIGDTVIVRSGYFGTAVESGRMKRLLRQGLSTTYQVVDTIITSVTKTLDYQYYVVKNAIETRENYYNFFYEGDVQAEAERRQLIVPSTTFTVYDTATSVTNARRQPEFPSGRTLARDVTVRWEVDLRPAIFQVLAGDTLQDIQGSFNVTPETVDSIVAWGVWMNGPAVGGWSNPAGGDWGFALQSNTDKKLFDDGTNGDQVAGDTIYTRLVHYSPDSLGIGSKGQVGQVFKFGVRGGDNEGGKGGFGNNHAENIVDTDTFYVIQASFGSINPAFYDAWDYDCGCPAFQTSVPDDGTQPKKYSLSQNYPNPFNPSTKISYSLASPSQVTLKIFNVIGQEVATLVNERQAEGRHEVNFSASSLPSGVYFYKLVAGDFVNTKKMLLMK